MLDRLPCTSSKILIAHLYLVQAVHIDNTRGNQINREYLREYVLPEWVDVDQLRAKLSEDSTLTVEVPIPHDRVPAFNRQIKITK